MFRKLHILLYEELNSLIPQFPGTSTLVLMGEQLPKAFVIVLCSNALVPAEVATACLPRLCTFIIACESLVYM